jgi:hypothetical protein
MVGDSSSQAFSFAPQKRHRQQEDPFFPSQNDRRRHQQSRSDQSGEEYSSETESIRKKYYSEGIDLINVDDEMETTKRSTSTPRCEVGKEKTMIRKWRNIPQEQRTLGENTIPRMLI